MVYPHLYVQVFRAGNAQPQHVNQGQVHQHQIPMQLIEPCVCRPRENLNLCLLFILPKTWQPLMLFQKLLQMFGMQYSTPYQPTQSAIPWQNAQIQFGTLGGRGPPIYPPCMGTPIPSPNAYNQQLPYPAGAREAQFEGGSSNRIMLPFHNVAQGGTFNSHPSYMIGNEYYNSQSAHGPVPGTHSMLPDSAVSQQGPGQTPPTGP